MLRSLTAIVAGCLCFSATYSQSKGEWLKVANTSYEQGDYYKAAQYYERVLGVRKATGNRWYPYNEQQRRTKKLDSASYYQAAYQLGQSYRMLNDYTSAKPWYALVTNKSVTAYPLSNLYFGICLRATNAIDSAETAISSFIGTYKQPDVNLEQAKLEQQNIAFIKAQKAVEPTFTVNAVSSSFASNSAYAPVIAGNGKIAFTSVMPDTSKSAKDKPYVNHIYQAAYTASNYTANDAVKLVLGDDENNHAATPNLSTDGSTMFFTQTEIVGGKTMAAIYKSKKTSAGWGKAEKLSAAINADGSNSKQPFVTADGNYLFFASDRPGGKGGFDLWLVALTGNNASGTAQNLAAINTAFNDEAPFYHTPSGTLVFASNGRVGMGGYDLYSAKGNMTNWSDPVNLGAPANSVKDDIYFSSTDMNSALFSSDRSTSCCLQLFALTAIPKPAPPVVVTPEPEVKKPDTTPVAKQPIPDEIIVKEPSVYFGFNSAKLTATAKRTLDSIASSLIQQTNLKYQVNGYTDSKGSDDFNLKLSMARVKAAMDYLSSKGIDASRFVSGGFGECCPVASETLANGKDDASGRLKNRRVEFKLIRE